MLYNKKNKLLRLFIVSGAFFIIYVFGEVFGALIEL